METDPMKRSRLIRIAGKLWRSLRNAAAILLTLIVLSAGMTVWTNSQTAHALKFRIDQLLHENGEPSVSSGGSEGNDKDVIIMKITDPKELTAVKRQIPELRIPENLPEGYEFSSAEVERWENEEWEVVLYYGNEEKQLYVKENSYEDASDMSLALKAEEIQLSKGTVYYIEENDYAKGVFFLTKMLSVKIFGTADREDLLQIANELR